MLKDFFVRRKKYASIPNEQAKRDVPEGLMKKCFQCHKIFYRKELKNLLMVCPNCDYHHQLNSWERIESLFDENTFEEWDQDLRRSEEHTSELQSRGHLVCRLL